MNNPSKGILLPKKRNKVVNKPFEEQTVVKKVEDIVLVMRNVVIETDVLDNNLMWRVKTYEAFKEKAREVSDEYGINFYDVEIPLPIDKPVKCLDGYSEVLFVAHIPTDVIRKELN